VVAWACALGAASVKTQPSAAAICAQAVLRLGRLRVNDFNRVNLNTVSNREHG
jgi:hypothetical protein